MQYPETRYEDSLSAGISSTALSMTADTSAPTRTQGIITIGRLSSGGGPNTEDVYYTGVAGNVITIGLRGLSQTALTMTSVLGNQKVHNADESLEITTHHNYITDLLRKSENDTITGQITFDQEPLVPGLLDENGNEAIEIPATTNAVNYVVARNSATGVDVKLESAGDDADIGMEIDLKGTGILTIPDQSETKTNAAPIANEAIPNKKYVDDAISSSIVTANSRTIVQGVLGVAISAGDLSGYTNLLYFDRSVGTWKKVTNSVDTNYFTLGLALEEGSISDTIDILLQGQYDRVVANTSPSFSGASAGNANIGDTSSNHARAIRINNTAGGEFQFDDLVLSLRQQGAPSGSLNIDIVLEQTQASASQPACFYDTGVGLIKGAVVASASISQSLFSGTYQDFTVTSLSAVRIPPCVNAFVVLSTTTINGSNYYQLNASSVRALNTATWTGTGSSATWSLSSTPLTAVGKSLKIGSSGNPQGGWGIAGWESENWSRTLGLVLNSTSVLFNPNAHGNQVYNGDSGALIQVSTANTGFLTITSGLNFVPNKAHIEVYSVLDATADSSHLNMGAIDPVLSSGTAPVVQALVGGVFNGTGVSSAAGTMLINGTTSGVTTQNPINIVRSERGYYLYLGYPASANFLSVGAAGFAGFYFRYRLTLIQ